MTESSVGSQKVLSYGMNEELKNCGSGDPGLIPNPDSLYELMRYAKVCCGFQNRIQTSYWLQVFSTFGLNMYLSIQ